ncbi:MAG: UDP-N-acetylmuramoyl-L-alanine--D-glutamate ligase [Pantoea sp. Brub]|nr:UDP-N-acetylmuramoyl-L-alanine--D-glutamate ligase [Pantoea sp. Brub]
MLKYKNKNILIIGMGITGLSCIDFFLTKGIKPRIIDTRMHPAKLKMLPPDIEYSIGNINIQWILSADLIITSPGVALTHPIFKKAIDIGINIISDIELFCQEAKAPVIAITGSNGKSTVVTLLSNMAKFAGYQIAVGGNIGVPVLSLLKHSVQFYIIEISSFQLEYTSNLKTIAATVLNVTENHLNRYPLGLYQYRDTKLKIYQNALFCIFNASDNMTVPKINTHQNYISFGNNCGDYYLNKKHGKTWIQCIHQEKKLNTEELHLIGQHNYMNALAALAIADTLKFPYSSNLTALKLFKGLKHRLQLISERNNVQWINDSKSTNISSTKAALNSINCTGNLWLLLGGDGKGHSFASLSKYLTNNNMYIFCFGQDRKKLASLNPKSSTCTKTLCQAMKIIATKVKPGDVVLFSPACTSFDQFYNFEHRGEVFIKLVHKLS